MWTRKYICSGIKVFHLVFQEMKEQGFAESRLQLLTDISGAFRPGVLTALVGMSGAGKTTLMDVLAGRKTSGSIEGSITLSGYPKNQETFARISGYCEQTDIHSPNVTVYESILYSAWLRLSSDVNDKTRQVYIQAMFKPQVKMYGSIYLRLQTVIVFIKILIFTHTDVCGGSHDPCRA
jgi:ABC-type cobalamin/Fe3+-siderophores transport system ATPase subunit